MNLNELKFRFTGLSKILEKMMKKNAPIDITYLGSSSPEDVQLLSVFFGNVLDGRDVLRALDFSRGVRSSKIGIVGQFSNEVEKECFSYILRGNAKVFLCVDDLADAKMIYSKYFEEITRGALTIIVAFRPKNLKIANSYAWLSEVVLNLSSRSVVIGDDRDIRIKKINSSPSSVKSKIINLKDEKITSKLYRKLQNNLETVV